MIRRLGGTCCASLCAALVLCVAPQARAQCMGFCGDGIVEAACGEACEPTPGAELCDTTVDEDGDGAAGCLDVDCCTSDGSQCGSDCQFVPLCGHIERAGGRIRFRDTPDQFKFVGRIEVQPSYDPLAVDFSVALADVSGVIFETTLSAGQLVLKGTNRYDFRDKDAKLAGGFNRVSIRVKDIKGVLTAIVKVIAYGDLSGAVLSDMTVQISGVGGGSLISAPWSAKSTGWNLTRKATKEAPLACSPPPIQIDTFNVALAGAFIPFEQERRMPINDALALNDADILCLQEVWEQTDKDAIASATAGNFPYQYQVFHDLTTPVDDPEDQEGMVPAPPTVAPCENALLASQLDDVVDCLRDNCSTTFPGDENGKTTSTACATEFCVGPAGTLIFGTVPQQRCYACGAVNLPTRTFADIRTHCKTEVNAGLAFDGQNGLMILSKLPLSNTNDHVMPGTWNRRPVLSATATLPSGAEIDVYCNHLTPIFGGITFPYTGDYGDGMSGSDGWEAEQFLQAQKLIAYVEATSGPARNAVILGDMNAGRDFPAQSIVAEGEPTLDLLEGEYVLGVAAGYTPLCTFCSANPITGATTDVWIDQILFQGVTEMASTARIYDANTVDVGGGMFVPLSDHYGLSTEAIVRP